MNKLIRFYLAQRWHSKRNEVYANAKPKTLQFWKENRKVKNDTVEIMLSKNVNLIEKFNSLMRTL